MSKPYSFVPFLDYKPYNEDGNLEGIIKLKIKVLTPVHISSGKIDEHNGKIYKKFLRINGEVTIPGTSIKGCVRSIAEAISYSCYQPGKQVRYNKLPDGKTNDRLKDCIICKTFGSMGRKSKVIFSDFKLTKGSMDIIGLPNLYAPHIEEKLYLLNGKYKGYKFYYHGISSICEKGTIFFEFAKEGAEFEGEVYYNGLTQRQLKLLCYSLGLNDDIQPKIGYGKPAYYGSVKFLVRDSDEQDKYKKYANQYYNESDANIRKNIDRLKTILSYNNAKRVSDWTQNGNIRTY